MLSGTGKTGGGILPVPGTAFSALSFLPRVKEALALFESDGIGFRRFFAESSGGKDPRQRPWQCRLADPPTCGDRLIQVPTGFGKTLGVLAAYYRHSEHTALAA